MPLFLAALFGGLVDLVGTLVGRVLVSLALGYVAFSGVDASISAAKAALVGNIHGMSGQSVAVLSMLHVGTLISAAFSGLLTRLSIQGLQSGVLKKMVQK